MCLYSSQGGGYISGSATEGVCLLVVREEGTFRVQLQRVCVYIVVREEGMFWPEPQRGGWVYVYIVVIEEGTFWVQPQRGCVYIVVREEGTFWPEPQRGGWVYSSYRMVRFEWSHRGGGGLGYFKVKWGGKFLVTPPGGGGVI